MRYHIFLLLTALEVSILGLATPAPADSEIDGYNLQRIEIRGMVESVQDQEAYVRTDDGEEIRVQLGPQSYWDERGYYLSEGEYVRMEVWYDPYGYTDWYFAGQIWGSGFHFVLTNSYGVPYWIIMADDYYYSLGYRASCVSYMVWYDCPPAYFVYVILPPPPPYYTCYYGPRWRHHHREWHHHGPGYGDRPRWDGRDHRPGRREGGSRSVGGPNGDRKRSGGTFDPADNDKWRYRRVPMDPPKMKPRPQPRQDQEPKWQAPRAQPQPRSDQWQKYRAPVQPREPKYQERAVKPPVREIKAPNRDVQRQYRPPQINRQFSRTSDAKRSPEARGYERKSGRR
jgi:hypothetical protein